MQCIEAILHFSSSLDSEPDLISVLVQHRLDFHATELLRWLLNHRQLSQQQLIDLQGLFKVTQRALIGERCVILSTFDYSAGQILDLMDPGYDNRVFAILGIDVLKVSGALKKDRIRFLERCGETHLALGMPLPERLDRAAEIRAGIVEEARPRRFILTGVFFPGFLKGIEKNAEAIARQRLALSALAVEQYYLLKITTPSRLLNSRQRSCQTRRGILFPKRRCCIVVTTPVMCSTALGQIARTMVERRRSHEMGRWNTLKAISSSGCRASTTSLAQFRIVTNNDRTFAPLHLNMPSGRSSTSWSNCSSHARNSACFLSMRYCQAGDVIVTRIPPGLSIGDSVGAAREEELLA